MFGNLSSISLSYYFLIVGILFLIAFFYFKVIYAKSGEHNAAKDKIVGSMKNPKIWRSRNNFMSYICFFWFIVSVIIFAYLKFFTYPRLLSGAYILSFLLISVLSIVLPLMIKNGEKRAH